MKALPSSLEFEWDAGNFNKSVLKHSVSQREAEEIFLNRPLIVLEDYKHSAFERRFLALGKTDGGRLLFCSFTLRLEKVRVISIRDMNRKEALLYGKTKKNTTI